MYTTLTAAHEEVGNILLTTKNKFVGVHRYLQAHTRNLASILCIANQMQCAID